MLRPNPHYCTFFALKRSRISVDYWLFSGGQIRCPLKCSIAKSLKNSDVWVLKSFLFGPMGWWEPASCKIPWKWPPVTLISLYVFEPFNWGFFDSDDRLFAAQAPTSSSLPSARMKKSNCYSLALARFDSLRSTRRRRHFLEIKTFSHHFFG